MDEIEENIGFFQFENKERDDGNRIFFQPGDVLGYAVRGDGGSIAPLSIVFRSASAGDDDSMVVDMFSYAYAYSSDAYRPFCEASICAETVVSHRDVVPQIAVNFGETCMQQ